MSSDRGTGRTRRRFLGTAAGATGVALATTVFNPARAAAAVPADAPRAANAAGVRGFTSGRSGLELGGVSQGLLRSADGGDTYADVITEAPAGDQPALKHVGLPKYDDFTVDFGFDMALEFNTWVVNAVAGFQPRKDGTLVTTDQTLTALSGRAFQQALITELTIPTLDAASKQSGALALTFAPDSASDVTRTGKLTSTTAQKPWLTSNFRLEIDGLDCTKVSKIGSITIKQLRNDVKEPTQMEYPNLLITFTASTIATWKSWFNDFVIIGNNGQNFEKNGRIVLLSNTLTELAVLQLHHMGIFRLDPDPEPPVGADSVVRARAELYVETMNFSTLGSYILT